MPANTLDPPQRIVKLLQKNTVMSLKQLRTELDRPRSSLFRDLKKLDLISSYTHTGQYHALSLSPKFDENGLWFFKDVGFSKYGTLKMSLVHFVSHTSAGMTHGEMKALLGVEVQKPLSDLVKTHTITRRLLPNRLYVYLSIGEHADAQFQHRLVISEGVSAMTLPPQSVQIEILVEVIRTPVRPLNETLLASLLRKRGVTIKDDEIGYVLTYYDIKKNGF